MPSRRTSSGGWQPDGRPPEVASDWARSPCKHNPRHRIARGELRLVVKNPGPAAGENGYCSACGQLMLDAAYRALDRYRGALAGASDE